MFKNFVSTIDFLNIRNGTAFNPTQFNHGLVKYSKLPKAWSDLFVSNGWEIVSEFPILRVNGLLIGLEICLDHSIGVLANLKVPVDVQIIVSAGMSIGSGPSAVKSGGSIYLVDGNSQTEFAFGISPSIDIGYSTGYSPIFFNNLPIQMVR